MAAKSTASEDPEPVLVEVDVGDLLDRPAANGIVAVVGGIREVVEHVGSAAAGERIDAEEPAERVVALAAHEQLAAGGAADDLVVALAAEHRVRAGAACTVSSPSLAKMRSVALPVHCRLSLPTPPITVSPPSLERIVSLPPLPKTRSAPVPVRIESLPSEASLPPTTVMAPGAGIAIEGVVAFVEVIQRMAGAAAR